MYQTDIQATLKKLNIKLSSFGDSLNISQTALWCRINNIKKKTAGMETLEKVNLDLKNFLESHVNDCLEVIKEIDNGTS